MDLRTEIRQRLRGARDWTVVIGELEREADGLASGAEKSDRLVEVGRIAEEVIPDRERAIGLYRRAFQASAKNLAALGRARAVCREMGRLDLLVEIGGEEMRAETDAAKRAEIAAQVGEALLDLGKKDEALPLLESAADALEGNTRVRDAPAAAQYDTEDWASEVERLSAAAEKADSTAAARMCLRAARILRMETPDDPAYEKMLGRVLANDPQSESAGYLTEELLARKQRWDELAALHESRAHAVPEGEDRAVLCRGFALAWQQRFGNRDSARSFDSVTCHTTIRGLQRNAYSLSTVNSVFAV